MLPAVKLRDTRPDDSPFVLCRVMLVRETEAGLTDSENVRLNIPAFMSSAKPSNSGETISPTKLVTGNGLG